MNITKKKLMVHHRLETIWLVILFFWPFVLVSLPFRKASKATEQNLNTALIIPSKSWLLVWAVQGLLIFFYRRIHQKQRKCEPKLKLNRMALCWMFHCNSFPLLVHRLTTFATPETKKGKRGPSYWGKNYREYDLKE